jgi:hypothetical protein
MKLLISLLLMALLPAAAADIHGTWDLTTKHPSGDTIKAKLVFKEEGGTLAGTFVIGDGKLPVQKLDRKGDIITFQFPFEDVIVTMKLARDGDKLKGEWTVESGESGAVTAERVVPSPVAGKWKLTATTPDGNEMKVDLEVKDDGGKLSGTLTLSDGTPLPISGAKYESGVLGFKLDTDQGPYLVKLTLDGVKGKGSYQAPDGGSGTVVATR